MFSYNKLTFFVFLGLLKNSLGETPVKAKSSTQHSQITLSSEHKIVRRLSQELENLKDSAEKLTEEKNELIEQSELKERKIIELEMALKDAKKKLNGKGKLESGKGAD